MNQPLLLDVATEPDFWALVYGEAEPAGSKRAFIQSGRAVVTDANPRAAEWKSHVAQHVGTKLALEPQIIATGLWNGPIELELNFYRPRPSSHYGKRGLLPSAPAYPTTRPDALKLARAVEDALTGLLWRDDARIVDERIRKRWADSAKVEIRAWRLT